MEQESVYVYMYVYIYVCEYMHTCIVKHVRFNEGDSVTLSMQSIFSGMTGALAAEYKMTVKNY